MKRLCYTIKGEIYIGEISENKYLKDPLVVSLFSSSDINNPNHHRSAWVEEINILNEIDEHYSEENLINDYPEYFI